MRSTGLVFAILWGLLLAGQLNAGMSVSFDADTYVTAPGATFDVRILIDGDDSTPAYDGLSAGLFSYGIKVGIENRRVRVSSPTDIVVPSALNFFGFSAGASRAVGNDFAAVKGNVEFAAPDYAGTLLATISMTNLASAGQSYTLTLDEYRTFGVSEEIFVDGDLNGIDDVITFGSAMITVAMVGDMDLDDDVDFDDIAPFVQGLVEPAAYDSTYGYPAWIYGDIDQNGVLDFGDITGLVNILTRPRGSVKSQAVAASQTMEAAAEDGAPAIAAEAAHDAAGGAIKIHHAAADFRDARLANFPDRVDARKISSAPRSDRIDRHTDDWHRRSRAKNVS
ncbi:MAG: hypothetical protein ACC645_17070, partial [Pirellulales bacterium]